MIKQNLLLKKIEIKNLGENHLLKKQGYDEKKLKIFLKRCMIKYFYEKFVFIYRNIHLINYIEDIRLRSFRC